MDEQNDSTFGISTSLQFQCCAFCPTEKKELYKCPRCTKSYCSIRCYRNKKHLSCSENFYQDQCLEQQRTREDTAKSNRNAEINRPTMTFEEFMESKKQQDPEDEESVNPQIPVSADEEVLFDSDDEPEYLGNVVKSTLKQFNELDTKDLDLKLLSAGLPSAMGTAESSDELTNDQMEALYAKLNDEEKKSFTKLADEMFAQEMSQSTACFIKPKHRHK